MNSRPSVNKNYSEAEFIEIKQLMWKAFDEMHEYKDRLCPEEFFLAGYI